MLPASALDELITGVYRVAHGEMTWQHWLAQLSAHAGLHHAILELQALGAAPQPVGAFGADNPDSLLGVSSIEGLRLRCSPHDETVEATWEVLRPHLQRVLGLPQFVADQLATVAGPMRSLTEVMGVGLLLLHGSELRVDYANASARLLLERTQYLGLSHGCLVVHDALIRKAFDAARRDVTRDAARNGRQLWFDEDAGRFGLMVHSMNAWSATRHNTERAGQTLVIVSAAEQLPGLRKDYLAVHYGLSPKESRLVIGLMQGCSLDAQALRHGVSIHTLRTQLKSALRKCGATSQVSLLNLLSADPCLLFDPPEVLA